MTDKEKAEEIANERCKEQMCWGRCNIHKDHHCGYWHYNYECALKGIEYGLAEGRKEAYELYNTEVNDIAKDYAERLKKLEKDNAELKKIAENQQKISTDRFFEIKRLYEQIEKMKCCYNCKKWNDGQCKDVKDSYFYTMADFNCDKWELAE